MLKLNALNLLEKKRKTKYWLYKCKWNELSNFTKMIHNKTKSIKYDNLGAMCYILECSVDELLVFENEEQQS